FRFVVHVLDGCAAAVTHGRTHTAHQLIDDGDYAALVRHPTFDAFRYQFVSIVGRILEVAVSRAIRHGAKAAHTTIRLVGTTLIKHHFPGCFFSTREHAAHHARGCAGS